MAAARRSAMLLDFQDPLFAAMAYIERDEGDGARRTGATKGDGKHFLADDFPSCSEVTWKDLEAATDWSEAT